MSEVPTLTRADLAEAIEREIGISRKDARGLVDQILDNMSDALAKGENVKIKNFGTFVIRDKSSRMGRNPKTLEPVEITPRRVLTFRASNQIRDKIA